MILLLSTLSSTIDKVNVFVYKYTHPTISRKYDQIDANLETIGTSKIITYKSTVLAKPAEYINMDLRNFIFRVSNLCDTSVIFNN